MPTTQIFGPQGPGGYKLAVCLERNSDHERTKRVAQQLADGFKLEPWLLQVADRFQIFAVTFDGGRDFHTHLPAVGAANTNSYLSDYGQILPAVRVLLPGTNCVLLGVTDLGAAHGSGMNGECTASVTGAASDVFLWLHELGHAIANLVDEYVRAMNAYTGPELEAPNITNNPDPLTCKWRDLFPPTGGQVRPAIRAGQPIQTVPNMGDDEVGLVEGGAGFFQYGLWRPTKFAHCRMGASITLPFCKVCERAIVARIKGSQVVEPVPAPTTKIVTLREYNGSLVTIPIVRVNVPAAFQGDSIRWSGRTFARVVPGSSDFYELVPGADMLVLS